MRSSGRRLSPAYLSKARNFDAANISVSHEAAVVCVRQCQSLRQIPRRVGTGSSGLLRFCLRVDPEGEQRGTTLRENLPVRSATCQQRAFLGQMAKGRTFSRVHFTPPCEFCRPRGMVNCELLRAYGAESYRNRPQPPHEQHPWQIREGPFMTAFYSACSPFLLWGLASSSLAVRGRFKAVEDQAVDILVFRTTREIHRCNYPPRHGGVQRKGLSTGDALRQR